MTGRLAAWPLLAAVAGAVPLPSKMVGMYVLVADDSDKTYTSSYDWTPALHPYQQGAANTLFLTFINPDLMPAVPPAFANLARTRGTNAPGSVPSDVPIIFSVGGQEYSKETFVPSRKSYAKDTWAWLVSKERAEAMAAQVAQWPLKYGCDGIEAAKQPEHIVWHVCNVLGLPSYLCNSKGGQLVMGTIALCEFHM